MEKKRGANLLAFLQFGWSFTGKT